MRCFNSATFNIFCTYSVILQVWDDGAMLGSSARGQSQLPPLALLPPRLLLSPRKIHLKGSLYVHMSTACKVKFKGYISQFYQNCNLVSIFNRFFFCCCSHVSAICLVICLVACKSCEQKNERNMKNNY